ncbi:carbohydrate ABC transporter permease [Nonomuraea rhodomycinica]|uniref:Sugar ABC transporter permease n=1 Tax=Nonomuraea rhodomycinica TaxID=1712872 RepID=A0A7Y6MGE1_9ACTN|nr:sugar ABC transporter permease [Nonomuraea rhodomycinica]NUW45631.1 sugar ABC transporter permease [Nonomuraea rhodomycinica]
MTSDSLPRPPSPALGWVLLMPAGLGMLISLLLPTVQTIRLSLESGGSLTPRKYVGLDNYAQLTGAGEVWAALGFSLSLVLMPLLVALVAGPLLAVALDRAGTWPRRAGLVVLSLAPVVFSPTAVAVSWLYGLRPGESGLVTLATALRDPATAPSGLRLIVAAATFGVVCALAVMAFLPALRGGAVTRSMIVVGVVVALATLAAGLQTFTLSALLTGGARPGGAQTLAGMQYAHAFVQGRPGMGAAVATLTGIVLGVLGLVAAVVVVAAGVRLWVAQGDESGSEEAYEPAYEPVKAAAAGQTAPGQTVPGQTAPGWTAPGQGGASQAGPAAGGHEFGPGAPRGGVAYGAAMPVPGTEQPVPYEAHPGATGAPGSGGPTGGGLAGGGAAGGGPVGGGPGSGGRGASVAGRAAGIAALVAYAAVALVLTWPWLAALTRPSSSPGGLAVHVNTWAPAVIGAVVSVGVAYLGALGIGALRPLGRRSEWLLLPFAPWLFVGVGPLGVAGWTDMRNLGLIDTFVALVPPVLVSVPCLFLLTLLCRGLAERSGGDFAGGVVRPSLPMAGILVLVVTLLNGQDLLWPLLVAHDPGLTTAPVTQFLQLRQYGGWPSAGLSTPLPVVLVALLAAGAAQVLYLHRLALRAGAPGSGSRNPAPAA